MYTKFLVCIHEYTKKIGVWHMCTPNWLVCAGAQTKNLGVHAKKLVYMQNIGV
jgi:hypothetical protein